MESEQIEGCGDVTDEEAALVSFDQFLSLYERDGAVRLLSISKAMARPLDGNTVLCAQHFAEHFTGEEIQNGKPVTVLRQLVLTAQQQLLAAQKLTA